MLQPVDQSIVISYVAFGLGIRSALPLPELIADEAKASDVTIRLGKVEDAPDNPAQVTFTFSNAETICIRSKDVGRFMLKGGREIVVDPILGTDESALRLFILGPALSLLLYQRGLLALHGSAVAVGGHAAVFLGHSGWGKSTTAAALHARGHSVVADDTVAIQTDSSGLHLVLPGFPQLKLWPDAALSLGETLEALPQIHSSLDKRARRVAEGFSTAPLPLKVVYVLAEGDTQGIESLRPQEALIELVRHSYGIRLISSMGGSTNFLRCACLVRHLPVCRLIRPRSLPGLADMARMIEQDIEARRA